MEEIKTHKDLIVWQKSIDLVMLIYAYTKHYPQEELYAMTSQIRRCATSIPANIAEGSGRKNKTELIQFLHIALGSACEFETFLIISQRLKYLKKGEYETANNLLNEIIKMLSSLIKAVKHTT